MSPVRSPLSSFCEWIHFWQLWDESEKHSFLLAGLHKAETDHPQRLQYTGKITRIQYEAICLTVYIYLPVPRHSLSLRDLGRWCCFPGPGSYRDPEVNNTNINQVYIQKSTAFTDLIYLQEVLQVYLWNLPGRPLPCWDCPPGWVSSETGQWRGFVTDTRRPCWHLSRGSLCWIYPGVPVPWTGSSVIQWSVPLLK